MSAKFITDHKDYYLLVDTEQGFYLNAWCYDSVARDVFQVKHNLIRDKEDILIVAHLPLNNAPVLEGLPLLPELPKQEDELNKVVCQWMNNEFDHYEIEADAVEFGYKAASKKWTDSDMIDFHNFIFRHDNQYKRMGEYLKEWKESLSPTLAPMGFEPEYQFEGEENACKGECENRGCHSVAECKYVNDEKTSLKIVNNILQGTYQF